MLSAISLPCVKALYDFEIMLPRNPFNRLAINLVTSLYTTLHKLIGQKSPIELGLCFLGINTTQACVVQLRGYGMPIQDVQHGR